MNAEFFFNKGVQKSRNGDIEGAISDYTKAIELSTGTAQLTISTNESNGITTHIDVIETTEGNLNIYYNRGCAYFEIGNYSAAVDDYSKFIEYNQQDGEVYFRRAIANYCLGNDDDVSEDLSVAFNLDNKYTKELFLSHFGN